MAKKTIKSILAFWRRMKHPKQHEFALREIKTTDATMYLPLTRTGALSEWMPIVQIYNEFIPLDYELPGGMTRDQALYHISGYKNQLIKKYKESYAETRVIADSEVYSELSPITL